MKSAFLPLSVKWIVCSSIFYFKWEFHWNKISKFLENFCSGAFPLSFLYIFWGGFIFWNFYSKASGYYSQYKRINSPPGNSQQMLMTDFISNELRDVSILNISLQESIIFLKIQVTSLRYAAFESNSCVLESGGNWVI